MAYFRTGGGTDTSDANAVAGDILLNKTAYVNDEKVTGTMPNNGAISGTIEAGETFTVPAGYTSGGTITASSAGATITVTYDSSFYNKTMTCSNGTKTYTKTTTSSGSTTFNVNEEGTWTITCNGVSRTVDVVLEYTTQMAITKTIDIYSAASDTVSFTDVNGAKTVTTDANGHGSVSITFIPPSANITFTSLYAKNPSDLSQAYSKTITITSNTSEVKVMPTNTLYWYGYYDTSNLEDNGVTVDYSGTFTPQSVTHNTRDLLLDVTSSSMWFICVNSKNIINGTIKFLANSTSQYNGYGVNSVKKMGNEIIENQLTSTTTLYSVNASNQYFYFGYWALGLRIVNQTLYALWYE